MVLPITAFPAAVISLVSGDPSGVVHRSDNRAGDHRERGREAFYHGFGRALSHAEHAALTARTVLAGLADLAWGTANGDAAMADRGRRMLTVREPFS